MEIHSKKWVLHGIEIFQLAHLHNTIFSKLGGLDLGLTQILICVSPEPRQTVQVLLESLSLDNSVNTLFHQLFFDGGFQMEEFKKIPLFDP